MSFEYHRESAMFYLRLQADTRSESEVVAPGVVLDDNKKTSRRN